MKWTHTTFIVDEYIFMKFNDIVYESELRDFNKDEMNFIIMKTFKRINFKLKYIYICTKFLIVLLFSPKKYFPDLDSSALSYPI